jgi:diguanylate cyclase (GGDEF)-like protein
MQITELLAFKLQAEFCWIQLGPDEVFGNRPDVEGAGLEVAWHEIPGRSGTPLGKIWVAYRRRSGKRRIPADGFENAVRLSALAIETGARYSELVRRSEVDAVTNTQNRFAFDRTLDVMIEKHRLSCSKMGLIYIDLDGFKLVNDQYGHQTGDRFLQETAVRLGHQLRTQDFLARIGGDEFAVLLADVKSREEVAEIALRLESCFVEPFRLDAAEIEASASVGYALFPEDATTAMDLLECADAGMYREKRKRARERMRMALEAERSRM